MSSIVRVALAAAISLAFASNAIAQKRVHFSKVKAFTVEEKLYFDRASIMTGGPSGGSGGDGGAAAGM